MPRGGFFTGRPEGDLSGKVGILDNFIANKGFPVQYLVVAGGGGGGSIRSGGDQGSGGGGAGGYRCNVTGENSGGGASAEPPLRVLPGTTFTLTVGAGGPGGTNPGGVDAENGDNGFDSVFGTVTSKGGGGGQAYNFSMIAGGSGGGGYSSANPSIVGAGTIGQGFDGGAGAGSIKGGGGGGAAEPGNTDAPGFGGDGVASSITGSAVTRAGGGGGGQGVTGGDGGGGNGATKGVSSNNGNPGTANTGGGGGGGADQNDDNGLGGNGGSGVVIFSVPTGTSVSFSAGVTEDNGGAGQIVGNNTVYTVTATTLTTETVTIG